MPTTATTTDHKTNKLLNKIACSTAATPHKIACQLSATCPQLLEGVPIVADRISTITISTPRLAAHQYDVHQLNSMPDQKLATRLRRAKLTRGQAFERALKLCMHEHAAMLVSALWKAIGRERTIRRVERRDGSLVCSGDALDCEVNRAGWRSCQ